MLVRTSADVDGLVVNGVIRVGEGIAILYIVEIVNVVTKIPIPGYVVEGTVFQHCTMLVLCLRCGTHLSSRGGERVMSILR